MIHRPSRRDIVKTTAGLTAAGSVGLRHATREIQLGCKWLLGGGVSDELHRPQQPDAAHIANRLCLAQTLKRMPQPRSRRSRARGIRRLQQFLLLKKSQHSLARCQRNRMRVVGEAVQKRSGSVRNRVGYWFRNQDGAERRIATRQAFGGNQNVGCDFPMIDGKVAPGAAHASHDFIGDQENAMPSADLGHAFEVPGRGHDCAERCPADRFDDEGRDLAF